MEDSLQSLECPFTWDIPECSHYDVFMEKLEKIRDQSTFFVNGYCVMILDCFEKTRGNRLEDALPVAYECEFRLSQYKPEGLFAREEKNLWERCSDAIWHVLYSTQAHLAFKNNDLETTEKILKKIPPARSFDNGNVATILGLKSRILIEYGPYSTTEMAIGFLREAVQLDYSVSLWHFLLGKSLARNRRANRSMDKPCSEELNELEIAWEESRRPEYGVMLLHTYENILFVQNQPYSTGTDKLKETMKSLFEELQETAGTEWYVYARLAQTAMRLSWLSTRQNTTKLIKLAYSNCSTDSNGPHEDNTTLACLSCKFYKRIEKNFDKTLEYAIKAATYGGAIGCVLDTIKMYHSMYKGKDLVPLFDQFLNVFNTKFHKEWTQLSIHKANYLLLKKRDIEKAFNIYFDVMEKCGNDNGFLKKLRPLLDEAPYNSYYSVYEKAGKELQQAIRFSNSQSDIAKYESYLQKLKTLEKR